MICTAIGIVGIFVGLLPPSLQGLAIYFGIPIIFLGSLFGAYIVQLRRAPDIDPMEDDSAPSDSPVDNDPTETETESTNEKAD